MNYPGHNARPFDPDQIAHDLERTGHDWADKNAAAQLLEDTEKSILAEITADARPGCKSQAEAETMARASTRYRNHIMEMVGARKQANRARVSYEALKTKIELQRTVAANERAAMNMR